LVQRSLYEVGELWEQNRISVANEHLATAISEGLLNLIYPRLFATPRNGKSAVVTCVANEHHQIGGKMVADLFEFHGWRGYFLGANTPVRDVISLIGEKRAEVVALSVAIASGLPTVISAATEIRAAFPALPILVGGQALRWGGRAHLERVPGVRCLASLRDLTAWLEENKESPGPFDLAHGPRQAPRHWPKTVGAGLPRDGSSLQMPRGVKPLLHPTKAT
ncbi:MAG: cobalamin-dependent protein, partial [Opitutae bacterium]